MQLYQQTKTDPAGAVEFPNAIYLDGVDVGGTIRTGPAQICTAGADCSTSLPMPP
eukprot:SAG22_NODE_5492_length_1004_cov_2.271823_1_plen_54_part_10